MIIRPSGGIQSLFLSYPDFHGWGLHFHYYVLPPPLSFGQIAHSEAESFPPCQRRLQRVALADTEGAADLLRDNDTPEVVDAPNDTSSFHIKILPFLQVLCMGIVC